MISENSFRNPRRQTSGKIALLVSLLLTAISGSALAQFTSIDMGNPPPKEGKTVEVTPMQKYTVTGFGKSFGAWQTNDQGRFVYVKMTGDFDVSFRIENVITNTAVPEIQLMVRKSLDPEDIFFAAGIVYDKGYDIWVNRLERRLIPHTAQMNGKPAWADTWDPFPKGCVGPFPDYWVRVKREGNLFRGYYKSGSQTTWTEAKREPNWLNGVTLDMDKEVYVGMALSSDVDRKNKENEGITVTFSELTGFGTNAVSQAETK